MISLPEKEASMRIVLSCFALLLTTAATPPASVTPEPQARLGDLRGAPAGAVCRDRIDLVREERGLPKLERGTATGEEALLIAAVDHRIDGCSVMVMRNDTSDIRPLPAHKDGPLLRKIPDQ
jgi:hypothetical protein